MKIISMEELRKRFEIFNTNILSKKIPVFFIEDKNLYTFKPGYREFDWNTNMYLIVGNKVMFDFNSGNSTPILLTKEDTENLQVGVICGKQFLHYQDASTGKTMNEVELRNILSKFNQDEDGDYVFETLEEEYEYKKFIKTYVPVYTEKPVLQLYSAVCEVINVQLNTNSDFIDCLFSTSSVQTADKLYSVDLKRVYNDEVKKLEQKYNIKIDTEYSFQINGAYVNSKYAYHLDKNLINVGLIGTLAQCRLKEKEVRKKLENCVVLHLTEKKLFPLNVQESVQRKLNYVEYAVRLQDIFDTLYGKVTPATSNRSRHNYNECLQKLKELNSIIQEDVVEFTKNELNSSNV